MKRGAKSAVAIAFVFGAGAALSTQAYVNGRLASSLGSPELAGVANQAVGFAILLSFGIVSGGLRRAWLRVRSGTRLRWWHLAVALNSTLFILVTSAAAPQIGVAFLTVALVSGQTVGALLVDRLALSPAGRHNLDVPRLCSAALALLAVGTSAVAPEPDPHVGLLALAFLAGAGFAITQAAVGQVTRLTGEPVAAGIIQFGLSGACVVALAILTTGFTTRYGWTAAAPVDWTGGVLGVMVMLTVAITVHRLGVYRLMLCIVAGQAAGGVVIDIAAPTAGQSVTIWTAVGVLLTLTAVAVSGLSGRRIRMTGPGQDSHKPAAVVAEIGQSQQPAATDATTHASGKSHPEGQAGVLPPARR